jgi:ubiquinol-cytochrome c reductase subunit 7
MKYSLAPFIKARPWLKNAIMPVANWYVNAAGYRQLGLRYDDLLEEERVAHKLALNRLSPREQYDRVYRIRRSVQCSVQHKLLPRDQWTKPEEDIRYLQPYINDVHAEIEEKNALDTMTIIKKH